MQLQLPCTQIICALGVHVAEDLVSADVAITGCVIPYLSAALR